MGRVNRIHFVGVGGSGMCGIAEVLLHQGYSVTGSDIADSSVVRRLAELGAQVSVGHEAHNVVGSDVVVVSSAVDTDNPEIVEARRQRIPVVARAEMLGELMRYRRGIAVAGTHGKTTTTGLITSIFQAAGLDPTFVVGGLLKSEGRNAKLGDGKYLIAEADESDASFLFLQPMVAVITNVDQDHLSAYDHDFEKLKQTFIQFVHRLPFYGHVFLCLDDKPACSLMPELARPVYTYGLSAEANFRARDIEYEESVWRFTVERPEERSELNVELPLPGFHNVRNAVAAIAVATEESIADEAIRQGLKNFSGVGRRFETREITVREKHLTLVDDYGHHPTEVKNVLDTARLVWPSRRLLMVYQPHRYTRTRDLYDDFVRVLSEVDALILVEIYSAGEQAIPGADSKSLAAGIRQRGGVNPIVVSDPNEAREMVKKLANEGDVVIVQGAGNVSLVSAGMESC
ncbi:MAG TPA: UDP-N-acetylmuramate--L-alanine ligase [Pseudomonadales bacterium]|nr:UDP-N-acetylmuramate--L-alanine ligase [Pseudomonadales bacterium]|tara:strand:+ start:7051 stop:8427 length:1377 start_codon:yes stop_codon:yes gene_type:complete